MPMAVLKQHSISMGCRILDLKCPPKAHALKAYPQLMVLLGFGGIMRTEVAGRGHWREAWRDVGS